MREDEHWVKEGMKRCKGCGNEYMPNCPNCGSKGISIIGVCPNKLPISWSVKGIKSLHNWKEKAWLSKYQIAINALPAEKVFKAEDIAIYCGIAGSNKHDLINAFLCNAVCEGLIERIEFNISDRNTEGKGHKYKKLAVPKPCEHYKMKTTYWETKTAKHAIGDVRETFPQCECPANLFDEPAQTIAVSPVNCGVDVNASEDETENSGANL